VDVLDTCYTQLREQYLQQVGAALAAAARYECQLGLGRWASHTSLDTLLHTQPHTAIISAVSHLQCPIEHGRRVIGPVCCHLG